ncbi:hypothetical protein GCM10011574_10800 [Microbispora bryophytorum]|uniref:Uncharacterized protein n=1 Tax=Microbispora bryophytorum TaxID=1460882 RepID=A0A8H9L9P2_9ACTN|nr:hypothetical protein GCM10011574_10800 [Microbispora bryophytorum]
MSDRPAERVPAGDVEFTPQRDHDGRLVIAHSNLELLRCHIRAFIHIYRAYCLERRYPAECQVSVMRDGRWHAGPSGNPTCMPDCGKQVKKSGFVAIFDSVSRTFRNQGRTPVP